jgi:gliding motility-associated-like protein
MKKILLILFFITAFIPAFARHVIGGEVIYDYLGPGSTPNSKSYRVTLRLFRDAQNCTSAGGCAELPTSLKMGVYNNDNNILFGGYRDVPQSSLINGLPIISTPPCLTNEPPLSYQAGYYYFDVSLPDNVKGYTVSFQTCCRVTNIDNGGSNEGATYIGEIPGNSTLLNNITDNSARFETGVSIICNDKPFRLDFSATDPDGDQLVYEFYNAYNGGAATQTNGASNFQTPAGPPYSSINYTAGYSGFNAFGTFASLNSTTGIITGIAPPTGSKYIVAVVVKSYRNGNLIATHRKDFLVTVAPCDYASANLGRPNVKINCDSLNTSFANQNNSLLNLTFDWNFGDPASGALNTSSQEFPNHTFSAPGNYWVKLFVNKNTPCASEDSLLVKVWPGFSPAFAPIPPQCKNSPVQFSDLTTTSFPPINYWYWDFGVTTLTNDTSRIKNPTYTYTDSGTYHATFIVETVKGCRDTLYPEVKIVDKPVFFISNDTLICTIDTLQLNSNVNTGSIIWSPSTAINNINSFNPLVSPDITQTYTANYTDLFGCKNSALVKVSVVNEVSLLELKDTTICRTDNATLNLITDALYFDWTSTPNSSITTATIKTPVIQPTGEFTTYFVKASISNKCFKNDTATVKTVPYPIPIVSATTPICFGKDAQLKASGGSDYTWSPAIYLSNIKSQNPQVIKPQKTTTYSVAVRDTLGCPKPVSKPIVVEVIRIIANAGPSDTSIVLGQPLQLNATSNTTSNVDYFWTTPNTWLSDINVHDPISNPLNNITYKVIVTNSIGCESSDTINVKVFFLAPDIYVPTAFSPSIDGKNDLFRPIPLGIKSLELFSVYSRWGQLLYTTNKINAGWDGKYNGVEQNSGTYVWQANATDYKNKKIARKGTVILIR